jgi:glycerate kinase
VQILIATDSFGGFLSAPEACSAIAQGLRDTGLDSSTFRIQTHPMSDGGEGFLDALHAHRELDFHGVPIEGPLGRTSFATAARCDGTWIVESAAAMGLALCGQEQMPGRASSVGLGQLLVHLARKEEGPFIVGLGGSATVDAGLGMAQALGLHALDGDGKLIEAQGGATRLTQVARLVGPVPLMDHVFQVLCDVTTPLRQAAAEFGPQKGVHREDIEPLSSAHLRWADTLNRWRQDHRLDALNTDWTGGGAAGGVGFAAACILGGHLVTGAPTFARLTGLERAVQQADLVVTGEGKMDPTTFKGKAPGIVIEHCRADETRVLAIVGQATEVPSPPKGPDAVICSSPNLDPKVGFERAIQELADAIKDQRL